MRRLSVTLAVAGIALLLWSFVPSLSTGSEMAPGTTSTLQAANAGMGQALFAAKGCASCHVNRRAISSSGGCCTDVGPNLTNYTNQPEYLRRWLADPPALKPGTQMPNLNLSSGEIEDLIAFLNAPR